MLYENVLLKLRRRWFSATKGSGICWRYSLSNFFVRCIVMESPIFLINVNWL